jgi:hypothetical protein
VYNYGYAVIPRKGKYMTVVNVSVVLKDMYADPTSDVGVSVSGYLGIAAAIQPYGDIANVQNSHIVIPASA